MRPTSVTPRRPSTAPVPWWSSDASSPPTSTLSIDRFGNAVTNCLGRRGGVLEVAGLRLALARTYADVPPGEVAALCGSTGFIEVAVRDGSAAERLSLRRGSAVVYRPAS